MTTDGETPEDADIKAEIARVEAMINAPGIRAKRARAQQSGKYVRPKHAASLIVIDGPPGEERVVMGRRHKSLKFMPGVFVFPGGRVDPDDRKIACADRLHPAVEARLNQNLRAGGATAQAIAVAAVRELAEETGLLLGEPSPALPEHADWRDFAQAGLAPSIGALRLFARAVTPPGMSRRFDTWFFTLRLDHRHYVPVEGFRPSGELEELAWIQPVEAIAADTWEITRVMLVELMHRLRTDPNFDPAMPIPSYTTRNNRFHRKLL